MHDTTRSGRHRGPARYNPAAELSTIARSAGQTGVKVSAVLAASGGLVAAFALPAQAAPAAGSQATEVTAGAEALTEAPGVTALALAPAVVAPAAAAPAKAESVGVEGVKAVAKPKPKPAPVVEAVTSRSEPSSTASRSQSSPVQQRLVELRLLHDDRDGDP